MISTVYAAATRAAGGTWHTCIPGHVEDGADDVIHGYSVQKAAVAVALLTEVDRGSLSLGDRVRLTDADILGGSGTYHLQGIWGDEITVAGFLTAMLLVSDNTAVRLCARVLPAARINEVLGSLGLVHTRVEPAGDRFFLGVTTPRETADLLWRLATGKLLAPATTAFVLRVMRSTSGYHDGVRRDMSSSERSRVATKHGADYDISGAARHEAGIIFDPAGQPRLPYAMFATALPDRDNYGSTHPATQAHATIGRAMLDWCA
ncbi:serine hydrolase [Symbioplanes lichenis]|uniref:serine hydrolase n=1 Tax=Symbioplanes lichenis TaxID=1629072 RepID=UPI0027398682|nr:serine hydrolase [Actinoplanes lichenis]